MWAVHRSDAALNIASLKNTQMFSPKWRFVVKFLNPWRHSGVTKPCDGSKLCFPASVLAVSSASRAENQTTTSLQVTKNNIGEITNEQLNHFYLKLKVTLKLLRASRFSSAAQILHPRCSHPVKLQPKMPFQIPQPIRWERSEQSYSKEFTPAEGKASIIPPWKQLASSSLPRSHQLDISCKGIVLVPPADLSNDGQRRWL